MAAGDINYDSDPVRRAGNLFEIHGTLEADTTARVFAILGTKHHIVNAQLVPEDAVAAFRCGINLAANFSTATQGSLAVDSEVGTGTFRFNVQYA